MKRKILSLLMVFVLLCGMLPAALAADDDVALSETSISVEVNKSKDVTLSKPDGASIASVQSADTAIASATNDSSKVTIKGKKAGKTTVTVTVSIPATTGNPDDSSTPNTREATTKTATIDVEVTAPTVSDVSLDKSTMSLAVGDTGSLKATVTPAGAGDVTWASSDDRIATVERGTVKGISAGQAKITATAGGKSATCEVTVTDNSTTPEDNTVKTLRIDGGDITLSSGSSQTLTFTAKNAAGKDITSKVSGSWSTSNDKIVKVSDSGKITAVKEGEAKITVKAGDKDAYIWVTVRDYDSANISVTVYDGDEEYAFGDTPSGKGKAIYDQVVAELDYSKNQIKDFYFILDYSSSKVGSLDSDRGYMSDFDDVTFSIKRDGTFETSYEIREERNGKTLLTGNIEIIVKEGDGSSKKGDINYTGTRGGTVYFDSRDFEDYFEDEYPRGELEYVTFSRASNGTVYYDGKKISTSDEFYANPGKRDKDLDEVYYEPSSDTYTGTATVSFTAYGENSSGTSKSTSGVVSIVYSSANAKDISYQATNGSVRLNADDFVSTYKKATGVTSSNPTMYIRFTKLPSKGNLYVGYTANGGGSKVSTSTYYSSKSSASSYIGDITYVPSAAGGTETVEYTAYSTDASSGLKYTGKIVFTANAAVSNRPVNIYYNCTGGSVKFASADFSGSSESMALIDYLTFGTPSNGALYTNYANGSGDKVSAGNLFAYYSLPSMGYQRIDAVTYVPPMGWSGTASVPFTAYLVGGGTITGTVSISVTATSSTSLRDVKTTDWYATYVTDLMAAGVLTGYEDNTFRSTNNVTYGEILKLVMLATGYSEQSKTGTHWASGYVERALSDGIISERVNPDAYADRAAVADIAAKAMKLAPVTGGTSPFTDSANGYARALYNAGIITGYEENGRTYYRGANRIERSHIAAIIWRIMNYDGKTVTPPTNPSQPTTPSRPDTEVPDWLRS